MHSGYLLNDSQCLVPAKCISRPSTKSVTCWAANHYPTYLNYPTYPKSPRPSTTTKRPAGEANESFHLRYARCRLATTTESESSAADHQQEARGGLRNIAVTARARTRGRRIIRARAGRIIAAASAPSNAALGDAAARERGVRARSAFLSRSIIYRICHACY